MHISMIILAAGLSSRMGGFKPLLPVGDKTAIERSVKIALSANISEVIIVTGFKDISVDDINLTKDEKKAVRIIRNPNYLDGMFTSVQEGVRNLSENTNGFFIHPADCCAITSKDLISIVKASALHPNSVFIPEYNEKRGHPPLFPEKYAKLILGYTGTGGLKEIRNTLPQVQIKVPNPGVLLDMDTPEDYADLLAFFGYPTFPDEGKCKELLEKYKASDEIICHGKQVAKLALELSEQLNDKNIDPSLLYSSALIHDILRAEANHAQRAKEMLLQEGYPKAAIIVGEHMDLSSPITTLTETHLLYLADKLYRRGKITPLEETKQSLQKKFAADKDALAAANRRIEDAITISSYI